MKISKNQPQTRHDHRSDWPAEIIKEKFKYFRLQSFKRSVLYNRFDKSQNLRGWIVIDDDVVHEYRLSEWQKASDHFDKLAHKQGAR